MRKRSGRVTVFFLRIVQNLALQQGHRRLWLATMRAMVANRHLVFRQSIIDNIDTGGGYVSISIIAGRYADSSNRVAGTRKKKTSHQALSFNHEGNSGRPASLIEKKEILVYVSLIFSCPSEDFAAGSHSLSLM